MVHPVENDMGMIVWLKPSVPNLETFPVFRFRLAVQPMPFVLVQEDLQRCDSPAFLTLLPNLRMSASVVSDLTSSTPSRMDEHFAILTVLPFLPLRSRSFAYMASPVFSLPSV